MSPGLVGFMSALYCSFAHSRLASLFFLTFFADSKIKPLSLSLIFYLLSCHFSSQTGLLVACYQGFVDVVIALSQCPYLDVNWQDSEGNTALITAAQAGNTHTHTHTHRRGHSSISDAGLDTHRRWQAGSQHCWTHAHTDTNIHTQAVWH